MFSAPVPWISALLLVIAVVGALIAYFYGLRPYIQAARFHNPQLPSDSDVFSPKASVVVYCQSDEDTLMSALEQLTRQDYPDYEIIVVCDAGVEYASYISERISDIYSNVYVTFVQPGSHNLGRHKLANTLGIKAAKGDVIITTVANITVPSDSWLSRLLAPFCGEQGKYIDVSLGLSKIDFNEMTGPLRWFRQFDSVLTNGLWIGYASVANPYRGDGYNLAFRRSVFFKHKGYAKSIYLHHGEDDLFIHEIANGANTRVVVDPESVIVTNWGQSANRVWSIRKSRYDFTARWLPRAPFFRSDSMMFLNWLVPASATVAACLSLHNLIPAIIGCVTLLALWGAEIFHYRQLATRLGAVRLWWAVVPFWIGRPVANFLFKYDHLGTRKKNFTWVR